MAVKFRCEHCGKRLQVAVGPASPAVGPGARAMCPHCRRVSVVPADAESYSDLQSAAAPVAGPADDQDDSLLDRLALYVPTWGTSVALHLSVALLALMGSWMAVTRPPERPNFEANFVRDNKPMLKPATSQQQAKSSLTTRKKERSFDAAFRFTPRQSPVPGIYATGLRPIEVIGIKGDPDQGGGGPDGFGDGRGTGPGGGLDIFPVTPADGQVVFVIDRSGSMTDSIMYVKYELKRTIRSLKPRQEFHVIFYSSGPALEMPMRRLLPATEANKLAAYEFIDSIVPLGQTDPSEALRAALALRPNTIFLLSDGEFEQKMVNLVDKLNPAGGANNGRPVKINTLCFIYTAGEHILQTIASRNGGTYRFIGESDLEKVGGPAANTL